MITHANPLIPKSDIPLILIIGRISTEHQREESIEASFAVANRYLAGLYQGQMDVRLLGEQASGMIPDRATMLEAEELIEIGAVDLVIAEDLGRIYRNPRLQYSFVQNAVDRDTRVICIADDLDTADDRWETKLGVATVRHGFDVPDARRRVRRTAEDSFRRGGMVGKIKFGYIKLTLEEAIQSAGPYRLRIARDPEKTPIILAMRDKVLQGVPYRAIAAWLNDEGISPGPYVTNATWTSALMVNLLRDPILCGRRLFRKVLSKPIFRTGKAVHRKNLEPLELLHPELAHLTTEEFAVLTEAMDERKNRTRRATGRAHPRFDMARTRVLWPQQHARCRVCGGLMYKHARGKLKCENARGSGKTACWNRVEVSCAAARKKTVEWLLTVLKSQPKLMDSICDAAWNEIQRLEQRRSARLSGGEAEIKRLEQQVGRLVDAITNGGELDALVKRLSSTQQALDTARQRRQTAINDLADQRLPIQREELPAQIDEVLLTLAESSFEFAALMRRIFTRFEIVPVQALDTGQVRPRAIVELTLEGLQGTDGSNDPVEPIQAEIDLFEPPIHVRDLPRVVAAQAEFPSASLRKIARRLNVNYMTVKRALSYAKRMAEHGVTSPYVELVSPPEHASRWRNG